MADKIKLGLAAMLAVVGVAGFYFLSEQAMVVRIVAVIAGLLLAAGVARFTEPGQRFFVFSKEAVAETRKVVWPTRKETIQTTGVVFLLVMVMALFLWAVDATLLGAVQLLMGRKG